MTITSRLHVSGLALVAALTATLLAFPAEADAQRVVRRGAASDDSGQKPEPSGGDRSPAPQPRSGGERRAAPPASPAPQPSAPSGGSAGATAGDDGTVTPASGVRRRGDSAQTGTVTARRTPPSGGGGGGNVIVVPGGGWYPWGWGGYGFGGYYGFYDPWLYGYGRGYGYGYGYGYGAQYSRRDDGTVRLRVRPRDASVYVDGYYTGLVDDFDGLFQRLPLEPGPHRIEIQLEGFAPLAFDVRILPDRNLTLEGELQPAP